MTLTQEWTSDVSTTWQLPSTAKSGSNVVVECWGAGGGGGGGSTTGSGGGGGAGGGYSKKTYVVGSTITAGNTYNVVVGNAGSGGTGANNGGTGGDTYFNSANDCMASGGPGGGYGGASAGAGGTAVATTSFYGDTKYKGGNGYQGSNSGGGGGGGSGGTGSDGNSATSATGATAVTGGGPGSNGATSGTPSAPASGPGGGGGGANDAAGASGASGYDGKLLITYEILVSGTGAATAGAVSCEGTGTVATVVEGTGAAETGKTASVGAGWADVIYASSLTSLSPGTVYHVRAYATNSDGTAYGSEVDFTTDVTSDVSGTSTGAVSVEGSGQVQAEGTGAVLCGAATVAGSGTSVEAPGTGALSTAVVALEGAGSVVCQGTGACLSGAVEVLGAGSVANAVSGTGALDCGVVSLAGTGAVGAVVGGGGAEAASVSLSGSGWADVVYASALTGLDPGVHYHVRAYATNSDGTAYGDEETFTTSVTGTGALETAPIALSGGATVPEPVTGTGALETASMSLSGAGAISGLYVSELTGLDPDTHYYVRAYATSSVGTGYGAVEEFDTLVLDVTGTGALTIGAIRADGDGFIPQELEFQLTPLTPGTHYHARAFAINSDGVTYSSEEVEFTTDVESLASALTTALAQLRGIGTTTTADFIGHGSVDPAPVQVEGSGLVGYSGTGALTAAPVQWDGVGGVSYSLYFGLGWAQTEAASVSGFGIVSQTGTIGNGGTRVSSTAVSGSGMVGYASVGGRAQSSPTRVLGFGSVAYPRIYASGAVSTAPSRLSGVGVSYDTFVIRGTLTLASSNVRGSGTVTRKKMPRGHGKPHPHGGAMSSSGLVGKAKAHSFFKDMQREE